MKLAESQTRIMQTRLMKCMPVKEVSDYELLLAVLVVFSLSSF